MTYEHIHQKYQHTLALSDQDRMEFMESPILLRYPAADKILKRLERLFVMPKRSRMGNLLITGESNNGKTTLVEQFQKLHGQPFVNKDNEPVKPVIVAESPPSADEKSLYLSILERFHGPPRRRTAPATELRYQTIHLLRECHTQMLIIDEFHSLMTGTPVKQSEVMNTIKLLCNELRIPIVGVGTHEAVNVLNSDPQHVSRFQIEVLPLWKPGRDFQSLLVGFEEILPLKEPSGLDRQEIAEQLHTISQGNLGDLRMFLVECARKAIETGDEHITMDIVRAMVWRKPTRGTRERRPDGLNGRYP